MSGMAKIGNDILPGQYRFIDTAKRIEINSFNRQTIHRNRNTGNMRMTITAFIFYVTFFQLVVAYDCRLGRSTCQNIIYLLMIDGLDIRCVFAVRLEA
ncbi:MAG: hypothetical protein ABI813_09260 [Bacteroidota bacterium]